MWCLVSEELVEATMRARMESVRTWRPAEEDKGRVDDAPRNPPADLMTVRPPFGWTRC